MKTKIQKPFSIEEWKNGAKIETRDGRSVRILCTDMKSEYDIVGLAEHDGSEAVLTWLANGRYLPPSLTPIDDERDLVIVEEVEEPERWADDGLALSSGYAITNIATIKRWDEAYINRADNYFLFATERQAKSALAMARISQLMAHDERYGGVVTDKEWKDVLSLKYVIQRVSARIDCSEYSLRFHFLAFHTPEQRDLFIKENEQLVKDYLMIEL